MGRQHMPEVWKRLSPDVKQEILRKALEDAPDTIKSMMEAVKENIEDVFDLEEMVVSAFVEDKELLNKMFIGCGYKELIFIRNSGAYMGGLFGLVQLVIYLFSPDKLWGVDFPVLFMPTFGFVVGVITNWL